MARGPVRPTKQERWKRTAVSQGILAAQCRSSGRAGVTRVICPVGVLLGFCNKSLQALVWHFKRASLTLTIISRKKQKSEKNAS